MFWEMTYLRTNCYHRPTDSGGSWGNAFGGARDPHNEGSNMTFADGHVSWTREVGITNGMFMLTPNDRDNGYTHSVNTN
jgi:prepilin-type processing-associated H-X9-DG protein